MSTPQRVPAVPQAAGSSSTSAALPPLSALRSPVKDFDAAGRQLIQQVAVEFVDEIDVVATHPGGGKVYVGGAKAAQDKKTLDAHGIRHIVNCLDVTAENVHERNPEFKYLRFPITKWYFSDLGSEIASTNSDVADRAVRKYFDRLFEWGDPVLAKGQNILLHCLAGAHRAGTAGVVYLMHLEKLRYADALPLAKKRRQLINPCGNLEQIAMIYDDAIGRAGQSTPNKSLPTSGAGPGTTIRRLEAATLKAVPTAGNRLMPRNMAPPYQFLTPGTYSQSIFSARAA